MRNDRVLTRCPTVIGTAAKSLRDFGVRALMRRLRPGGVMVAALGALLIYSFAATGAGKGQAPDQNQSGIVVIKSNWHKGVRGSDLGRSIFDPSAARRNPNSDDPFQQMRQAQRRMAMRVDGYYYSATIRNDG